MVLYPNKLPESERVCSGICRQIAHLIDTLHLSYTEVFEIIPYRNLLMMQRDKLRAVYGGQKVNRISGKELANRRKKK